MWFCGGCCSRRRYHLKVAGPSEAGKTSFIKWVKHRQFVETAPTSALEIEEVEYNGFSLVFWDSRFHNEDPGTAITRSPTLHQSTIRSMREGVPIDGVVFCVDSSDPGRFKLAARHLQQVLAAHPSVDILLLLSAKCDVPEAVPVNEVKTHLQLQSLASDRECRVFAGSSATGEGLDVALEWVLARLKEKQSLWDRCWMACGSVSVPDLSESRIRP